MVASVRTRKAAVVGDDEVGNVIAERGSALKAECCELILLKVTFMSI